MRRNLIHLSFGLLVVWQLAFAVAPKTPDAVRGGEPPIRVGVFKGNGASASSLQNAMEALRIDPDLESVQVSAADIAAGALDKLDVVLFPGGGGGRQRTDLGDKGAELVRSFVLEKGKGAVGLCAGAYLLSDTPEYACLHLCPIKAIDREHDERGHGLITFKPTAEGLEFFPELKGWGDGRIQYYEGPILVPSGEGPTPCTVLATMESDVHLENDAPAGMTLGRPLFARAEAGKGRAFLSAGHPEATPGLRWMVARAVRWAARREAIPYTAAVVRPGLYRQEVLFDKALRDEEASLFQTLMYGESQAKMAAIRRLAATGSWDGPLWIRGFVRSGDRQVRVCAARTLVELEWTAGIPDIEVAVRTEPDAIVRADLALCLARLKAIAPAAGERGGAGGRREVAVTVDDLPLVNAGTDDPKARMAMVRKLLGAFTSKTIPVTAFVVGRNTQPPGGEDLLKAWLDAGVELGNHTGTHTSLHRMGLEAYEADILSEDAPLRFLLATKGQVPKYFRHPMLQAGRTQAIKGDLTAFLADHGYSVAPATIDNSEWIFAKAYGEALKRGDRAMAEKVKSAYIPYMEAKFDYWERQSKGLLGYEVKQILLFHSNALNAEAIGDLLAMIQRRGYTFVTLDEALKDPAYAIPDGYEGGAGISWLHRWAISLGGKAAILPGETPCPAWVMEAAGVDSE
jgi:peptidoglycan/xylan/chitin deacetylase (PgdA/CDA1 family)